MRIERAQGFTLLEVLVAIAITTMLVTAAITTFRGINRAQERARPEINRGQSARVLLDRLESELVSTLLLVKRPFSERLRHPWVFVGQDRVFGTNDSDAILFLTSNPARPPGVASEPGIRLVTYGVGALVEDGSEDEDFDATSDDRLALYRAERGLPRGMLRDINLRWAVPVVEDLHSLRLRYRGEEGWSQSWDSTDISQLDKLPLEVEISLRLYEEALDGSRTIGPEYTRAVRLPVRPLTRAAAGVLDASCPGGLTLRGCMVALRPLVNQRTKALRGAITALRRATPDRCWDPEASSPQLAELKKALGTLLSKEPGEICK